MKLSTKLILSFSVVILLVGSIGITSSYINEAVKDQVTAESEQAIHEVELAGEMGLQLYQSLARTQYLLEDQYRKSLSMSFSKSSRTRKTQVQQIGQSLKNFQATIDKTRQLIKDEPSNIFADSVSSAEGLDILNKLEEKGNIYSSLIDQLQNMDPQNYKDQKEFFTVTVEPYFRTTLLPLIEKGRKKIKQSHQQEIASLNSQLDQVGYMLIWATVIAILVAILVTFFLYRSIANPIKKIAAAAKSIGEGNLHERIDYSSKDELGQLSEAFDQMAYSLSQTTVSRDYVDSIIEAMADLLIVTDVDYKITRVNSAGVRMLGRSQKSLLDQSVHSIFKNIPNNMLTEGNSDGSISTDIELLGRGNREIPVSVSKGVIRNNDGNVAGYVIVASDISSEKEAQKQIADSLREKEVLLAEIHHRVKNNLAVISGLLQMQQWETENPHVSSALKQSQMRVRSIALVHENLYQSEHLSHIQFDKYMQDLLAEVQEAYLANTQNIHIKTDITSIALTVSQAIPCSLIINELLFNAFKNRTEGTIRITMGCNEEKIQLVIQDEGKSFYEEELESDSLRISLLEVLAKQLNADLSVEKADNMVFTVSFDVKDIEPGQNETLNF